MMSWVQIAIGAYVVYCVIFLKGGLFDTSNCKEGMEKRYVKTMRIGLAVVAPIMLASGILDITGVAPAGSTLGMILMGAVLAGIIVTIVLTQRCVDRKKVPQKPGEPDKSAMMKAAFEFDDEDKKDDKQG